jgi:ABC-type multidrug transport system fused ATPase/permease subunit
LQVQPLTQTTTTTGADGRRDVGILALYRPFFASKGLELGLMSFSSFVAGVAEAALLVLIANIALAVGTSGSDAMISDLGPMDALDLSLTTSFVLAFVLGIVRFAFQMLSAQLTARITADLTSDARAGTFADFAAASWAEQSRHSEAEVQDLLIRHVNRTTSAIGTMATAINMFFTLVALLISALVVDPVAAVLLVISGSALFLLVRPLSRIAKRVSSQQQLAGLNYGNRSLEAIGTSLEMRAFGVTGPVTERLATATAEEVRPTYVGVLLRQLVTSLYQIVTILLLLGGLLAVYTFVDQPLASLGAIVIILVRALNQSSGLQSAYHSMTETAPYLERLLEERAAFRAATPRSGDVEVQGMGDLRLEGVGYSYVDGRPALEDIDIEVRAGEAIGIIGPSGSGKSTLIQLLLRLRDPDTGRYLVNGVDAADIEDASWFAEIAFVPQESRLINDTVRANIAFYRDADDAEIVDAAKRAHVHDEIMAMPDGYDTDLGSRGGALSGGQRQRISIARALLRRPSILVLDEPTSALDMRSESLVHETFTELKGSVTIFAIAHRLSTLNTCDRIMVMNHGRIQAFGTRAELEESSDFYRDALSLSQIRS